MALHKTNTLDLITNSPNGVTPSETVLWIMDFDSGLDPTERDMLFQKKIEVYAHYAFTCLKDPAERAKWRDRVRIRVTYIEEPSKAMLDVVSVRDAVSGVRIPVEFIHRQDLMKEKTSR